MHMLVTFFIVKWFLTSFAQGLFFTNIFKLRTVVLYEEKPIGSFVVSAHALPEPVSYELGEDAKGLFAINSTTGDITIYSRIDREVLDDGSFTVYANNSIGDQASATVRYRILDVNDHLPYFPQQNYSASVSEASGIGYTIFSVSAVDEDIEKYAEIIYRLVDGNEDGFFKLEDPYICKVLVAKSLDYETKSSYTLNISASNSVQVVSNWTILHITVTDDDDLPARFTTYEYNTSISEDAELGVAIIQVTAIDKDKDINAPVTYAIDESTNEKGLFVINGFTGLISLNGSLDRESVTEYRIEVLAFSTFHFPDHGTVAIQIDDVNDNLPMFPEASYLFTVEENIQVGTMVGQVEATDADEGSNSLLSYSLLGGEGKFTVNSVTGIITVSGLLDREQKENYSFLVSAEEMYTDERFQTNVTVSVNLLDTNDNSPMFDVQFYAVALQEELPEGSAVVQVFASDSDFSSNANITYSLEHDMNSHYLSFNINPINGSITTSKQLDRENISEFLLTVKAVDGAPSYLQRLATVPVKVTLLDINDNSPEFNERSYTVIILESTAINSSALSVKASDKDDGENGVITYTLVDGNIGGVFSIGQKSGVIQVAKDLDREKVDSYSLVVRAADIDNKSSLANVTMDISDVNDNPPQFTSPEGYNFTVAEGTAGLFVGIVKAIDNDTLENAEIVYSLLALPQSASFRINSSTGELWTSTALDFEAFQLHFLMVQAEDRGIHSPMQTVVQVFIYVTDINDNPPEFVGVQLNTNLPDDQIPCKNLDKKEFFLFHVPDLTPYNTEIGKVMSCDQDTSLNAETFYRMKEGDGSVAFGVSNLTGVIYTRKQLRRTEKSNYNVTVIAENSLVSPRLMSNVTVSMIILDISDVRPEFTKLEYQAEISEAATIGTSVVTVNATNKVQDGASKFVFKLLYIQSSAGSNVFAVDPKSGLIITLGPLDRETTDNYTLVVEAKVLNAIDGLSSAVPVFVDVQDVDDNYPRFLQREYRFTPSELTHTGHVIGQVEAVDADKDNKSEVAYEISNGNEKGLFNITEKLGTIYVMSSLNDEATSTFRLVIRACDAHCSSSLRQRRGERMTFDEVIAVIEVQDENDHPPVFTQMNYVGGFYKSKALQGTIVATVQAVDEDFDEYGTVLYSIIDEEVADVFSVHPSTGEVQLSYPSAMIPGYLRYSLKVSAMDNLGREPFNTANRNASVHILFLNEYRELSLELGVNSELVQENINAIERLLRNITEATIMIRDVWATADGSSVIYFHAVASSTLELLDVEDFLSRMLNKTDLTNQFFAKWNVQVSAGGGTAAKLTASNGEFSAVVAAMMVFAAGVGVVGIIGIFIIWRKRRCELSNIAGNECDNLQKSVYKTGYVQELPFTTATSWHSMDIPGIAAYIDSKADGTHRSPKSNTKYRVQTESIEMQQTDSPVDISHLFRTPLRTSSTYRLKNGEKRREQSKQSVSLNHYEISSRVQAEDPRRASESEYSSEDTGAYENVESHENMAFDHRKETDEAQTTLEETPKAASSHDNTQDKKEANARDRRVRFDLRGVQGKRERTPSSNYPDIVVISGEKNPYENAGEEAVESSIDCGDALPTDLSSIFEDSRWTERRASDPGCIRHAQTDDDGVVVSI